jgi:DNA-binding NarL/FixJ family response regulator
MEMALLAGAQGYLTKDESPDQLIHAIRQTLAGKRFLSERALMRLGNKMTSGWLTSGRLPDPAPPVAGPTASPSSGPSARKSAPQTPPPTG